VDDAALVQVHQALESPADPVDRLGLRHLLLVARDDIE
jgi:hypothetical protein